jgi:hypothetical protein
MPNRVGFIFVSSLDSVPHAHFGIEHSLLMQVSGAKTVSFGRFESELARRHEVKGYWDGLHGRIESLPPKLAAYRLILRVDPHDAERVLDLVGTCKGTS